LPVAVLKPATSAATADIYYIHADHLGTPRKITRPNDNRVVWSWESEAFGNSLPDQNPAGLGNFVFNLRFPGQYYDAETGLFYNYFRASLIIPPLSVIFGYTVICPNEIIAARPPRDIADETATPTWII